MLVTAQSTRRQEAPGPLLWRYKFHLDNHIVLDIAKQTISIGEVRIKQSNIWQQAVDNYDCRKEDNAICSTASAVVQVKAAHTILPGASIMIPVKGSQQHEKIVVNPSFSV